MEQPHLLVINADDGAQVFYNRKQVLQSFPDGFRLEVTSDSVDLAIRVLNNAVEGGLRKAELMDFQEGITYFSKIGALKLAISNTITTPFLFTEPLIQRLQTGIFSVKVAFGSNAVPELVFGRTSGQLNQKIQATEADNGVFTFLLPDLQPDTEYYYQISQKNYYSKIFSLHTEDTTLPFKFSAWGDSQGGWKTFQRLTGDMSHRSLAFSIGLGDLVADGSEKEQWIGFLYALQPLGASVPIYPVIGNHDYDGYYDNLIPVLYRQHIRTENYFAWSYNNCYFVALDPNERFPLGIEGKQRAWVYEQMSSDAWQQADWRFILLHQPPYAQGWQDYHGDDFIRQLVEENAAAAKIDVVLSGHSHCYERLSKKYDQQLTHFLILGGAGGGLEPPTLSDYPVMDTIIKQHHYGLFEVSQNHIDFQVIGLDGVVLDKIRLSK
jgi:predicted phosphodiesterase